jgi:ubiquinone/menaquinone biosynthesis C-methylase UbiE
VARITRRRLAAVVFVVGAFATFKLGRGAIGHLMDHHNDLFVGTGSKIYDRLSRHLAGGLYRCVADEIVTAQQAGVVLDVGCGPGHLALLVAQRAPYLSVRGVDISADMVQRAMENTARAGLAGRVRFDVSGRSRLPYEDASVDLVVSTLSMHHWEDVPGMLRELARVVRPGGQVWIYDVRRPEMNAAVLGEAVPQQSFAAPRVEPMPLWVGPALLRSFVRCTLERR